MGPIQRANINAAESGDNTIVAAISSRKIRVLALVLHSAGAAVDIFLSSGDVFGTQLYGGTQKVALDRTGAHGSRELSLQINGAGWFETGVGEALNLNIAEHSDSSSSSSSESSSEGESTTTVGGVCGVVVYEVV